MKNPFIKLCAFIAIIVLITSCDKSETEVDKLAAYDAEKEQIMAYIETTNLQHYSTTINTELTKAERLMYVNDISSNNNEPDINLVEKTEMYLKENNSGLNSFKGGISRWHFYHDYSVAVDSKKVYDIYQFNPSWGLYNAYGDHWFEFGGGSHAQTFTSTYLSYYE